MLKKSKIKKVDSKYIKRQTWYVYIILCKDKSLYTGITKNLERRLLEHSTGKGAKYTRSRGANKIVYFKKYFSHSKAAANESKIKKFERTQKLQLIKINAQNIK